MARKAKRLPGEVVSPVRRPPARTLPLVVDLGFDDGLVADKPRDGGVCRVRHEVVAGCGLMDLAVDEDGDAVGQREDFLGPVRHEHDGRGAVFERPLDVGEERRTRGGVEGGGGLVEQQSVGRADQGAREADPLRLPAGQGAGRAVDRGARRPGARARRRRALGAWRWALAGSAGAARRCAARSWRAAQDAGAHRPGAGAIPGRPAMSRRRRHGPLRRSVGRSRRAVAAGSSSRRR